MAEKVTISVALQNCRAGNHNLELIYTGKANDQEAEVIRWCVNCGSVVVDLDCDHRISPGHVMKMRSPRIVTEGRRA